MKKLALIFISLSLLTSCMSMMGYVTTSTTIRGDEYTNTKYYEKKINLPIRAFGAWQTVFRTDKSGKSIMIADMMESNWYFIDRAYYIVDGVNYNYNAKDNKRDVVTANAVNEQILFDIPIEVIRKIAFSEVAKVDFRGSSGHKEFMLPNSYKEELKEYLRFMEKNSL